MSPLARTALACSLLLLLLLSSASAETTARPPAAEAAAESSSDVEARAGDLANVLTFSAQQIASAETALNSTAAAVFGAVNATKAAKAAFFQDAIAAPFGQLRAGGLRAGGLVKRTNRTDKAADWLTSELALAPFARAFSQVASAVDASPVGNRAFASAKPVPAAGDRATAAGGGGGPTFALPTPRQVLARVGSELRLPGGGPAEDVAAAVAEEAERAEKSSSAVAAEKAAAASRKTASP